MSEIHGKQPWPPQPYTDEYVCPFLLQHDPYYKIQYTLNINEKHNV